MIYAAVCLAALIAAALTFVSGFGLGTLLLPAFALFVPPEVAVAATAALTDFCQVLMGLNETLHIE